jgi:hypothetical protein
MAVAVARGSAHKAYLVAGAPDSKWENALGSELFTSGEWSAGDLLERYRNHWDFWKEDVKTHPLALPHLIRTSAVASELLEISGESWSLRRCGSRRVTGGLG